jgi:lysophospholipase L1-like esterase
LQASLAAEHLVDPTRTALIGYSIGGYGVLTAAGARLDPDGNVAKLVPGKLLLPYTASGAKRDDVTVENLRAIVAISPAGGGALAAWGAEGLRTIQAPLLLIAGNQDHTVDYQSGARAFFAQAVGAHRYLLTLEEAGHSIGLNPAPEAMRRHLWDQDWFEDPVWSKERVNEINAHFVTAFLDLYVKDDRSRAGYLDVAVPESNDGVWPAADTAPYAADSPGTGGITVWKGFQRKHAQGLELLQAQPGAAAVSPATATLPLHPPAPSGQAANADWALLSRYREVNAALQPDPSRIVFMGDSITEAWAREKTFGANPHFVGRGISGQTTEQMLIRFRADVIDLKPALVHVMAGTNDVAGNNGPESDAEIEGAIASMVELARANRIKVVLASIPPAADFNWRPGLKPIPRIRRLNAWLKAYANEVGIGWVDYWPALAAEDGSMKSDLSPDGVHPNSAGYEAMQPLTLAAIRSTLATP